MLLNKVYTKIKKLFNTKIVIEPKKEIEFKSKIPINFMKPLSNEKLMYMLLNKVYTKIKKLFNTKIVIEPKKEIEFKSKIPINFMK